MLQNEAMWHCRHYMYYYMCAFTVHGVTYTPHSPTHEFPRALRGDKHNCEAPITQNHCTLWKYSTLVGRELQQLLGGGSAVSHVFRAMNLLTNIFHTPTTRMREAQLHVLTIQSITREGYGELQFVNLHSLPLLREPHIIHNTTFSTSSQRTEAGFGGISWALPLVEGGETLPSSCSPLLATLDIATWLEQGQGRCHCELRPFRSANAFT